MDIENMHPFCLPFGFCHDATSSSIANVDIPATQQQQNTVNDSNTSSSNNNNNNNNINVNNNDNRGKTSRSKTSSPTTDELFRQLNNNTTTSLLQDDDIIIGSSSSIDYNGSSADVDSFYSLDLDLNGLNEETDNNKEDGTDLGAFSDDELLEDDCDIIASGIDDEDDLIITRNGTIDWYSTSCNKYSSLSLFSPSATTGRTKLASKNKRRKSLIRQALLTEFNINNHHNQVFHQHIVDPIDVKSSPTLAQLNLNSINDDPTDPGFWIDTPPPGSNGASTISSSTSVLSSTTHHHHSSQDLLISNSTSILNNQHHLRHYQSQHHHPNHDIQRNSNINTCVTCHCNHLNQHTHQHHLHTLHHQHSTHLNNVSSTLSSSHHHCNHNHDHQQTNGGFNSTSYPHRQQGSTCLAVTPFRGSETQTNHETYSSSSCCTQHNIVSNTTKETNLHQCNNNNNNLKAIPCSNQVNQQQQPPNNSSLTLAASPFNSTSCSINDEKQKLKPQQRSASPALVTSSSSPLSSCNQNSVESTSLPALRFPSQHTVNNCPAGNRLIDNKLKENIEYLTALLCNGNGKLDNNLQPVQDHPQQAHQQQQTISSTMARSYATLAQSLSTEPKLFERYPLNINNIQQQPQPVTQLSLQPSHQLNSLNPTNEASPCIHQHQLNLMNQQPNSLKRSFADTCTSTANHHWFNGKQVGVESSVSAADSTDSQISSLSNDKLLIPQTTTTIDSQRNKSSNLKVLSSLLNNNNNNNNKLQHQNCMSSQHAQLSHPLYSTPTSWPIVHNVDQAAVVNNPQALMPNHDSFQSINQTLPALAVNQSQQEVSVPVNGKPITLTPISNQANFIKQQQLQQPRPALFAQPASPSASSTASSGNNTLDSIGSSSSTNTPLLGLASASKKQRPNHGSSVTSAKTINRVGRPNSMSTECSLSSHDEGFSSQIDQDDNSSMRNSDDDDDDDVDSDDESFYGDYTNNDLIGASISDDAENKWTLNMGRTRRNGQKRYFWQYNVQSKGPKGTRICSTDDSEDPFVLPEASDPVFSNDCQVEGVKHSGKARRGDGNDLTPNPRKLLMIGLELKKLGKIINELAPVTDLPINARNKTRKEKNKLASRACRLKKKAQHEANKIKLYGLQREHQQVVLAIYEIRKLLNETLKERENKKQLDGNNRQEQNEQKPNLQQNSLETLQVNNNGPGFNKDVKSSVKTIAEQCEMTVAGQTSDYVNSVLEKVVSGCIDGGLQT